jgi:CRP-like cAMP-binding protein
MKLVPDIDSTQQKRIFDVLREESPSDIFAGMSAVDCEQVQSLFKVLTFKKNEDIVIAGEPIDFLGIIVSGSAFVMLDHKNYKTIKIGDMIGHMYAADMTTRDTHLATITASMDGLIAVLPFSDIKLEVRKSPEALFKSMMIASKYAMETFSYNLNGCEHNPAIKHSATAIMTKKLREFYFKNPSMRSFLNGADKKDEKFII